MKLDGKRVGILAEKQYQELEVWYPLLRVVEEGAEAIVIGPEAGCTYPSKLGYPVTPFIATFDAVHGDRELRMILMFFRPTPGALFSQNFFSGTIEYKYRDRIVGVEPNFYA